nr:response regulator [uncultured bacterium]
MAPLPGMGLPEAPDEQHHGGLQPSGTIHTMLLNINPGGRAAFTYSGVERALLQAVSAISNAVEFRDHYTASHQDHVSALARCIAQDMGLPAADIEGIRIAGTLHDIGKIAIPGSILNKTASLSVEEYCLVKTHAAVGAEILEGIDFPWPVREMVYQHHERLDGSGYPRGLAGREVMLGARILGVADTVSAIVSHRAYRAAASIDTALEIIHRERGTRFDGWVVDTCSRVLPEYFHRQGQPDPRP